MCSWVLQVFKFLFLFLSFFSHFLSDQAEARRNRVKQSRLRKEERQKQKREEVLKQYAREDDAASKTPK